MRTVAPSGGVGVLPLRTTLSQAGSNLRGSGSPQSGAGSSNRDVDKAVWALASPTLAETFLVSLVGIVDMIQVGRLGAAALRGAGDTRTPMVVNLAANLVNVVFNAILIWGLFGFPKWGVFGAGVATTLSRLISAVWFLVIAVRGNKRVRLDFREKYKPNAEILRKTYSIGIPASVEQILLRSAHVLFARVVSSMGTVVFASHQVAISLMQLTFMPGQAFSVAATTLVSRHLGAGSPHEAERHGLEDRGALRRGHVPSVPGGRPVLRPSLYR
jgi:Na+-driven multidrug efflux pump